MTLSCDVVYGGVKVDGLGMFCKDDTTDDRASCSSPNRSKPANHRGPVQNLGSRRRLPGESLDARPVSAGASSLCVVSVASVAASSLLGLEHRWFGGSASLFAKLNSN